MRTKYIVLPFLFLLIISTFSSVILVTAQTVNLTVATNKQTTYDFYDPITLSGTISEGSVSPATVLVGIQVNYPNGSPMVLRTVQTGSGEVSGLPETITSAYASTSHGGSSVSTLQNGEAYWFTATIADQDSQEHDNMVWAITLFDGNGVPIGIVQSTASVGAGATQSFAIQFEIPTWAHSGAAYGYADLYSALPQNPGGLPVAQEQSFQFTISGGTPSSGPAATTASAAAGAYSLAFKLPPAQGNLPLTLEGACKVYASATYDSQDVTANTGFNWQLIGDFNFSGVVNGNDLFIFVAAYIDYYEGEGITNTLCDINNDGKMTATDFFLFVAAYIQYWSS